MNQDQVKELLVGLRPAVPEFTVLFTGKSSRIELENRCLRELSKIGGWSA